MYILLAAFIWLLIVQGYRLMKWMVDASAASDERKNAEKNKTVIYECNCKYYLTSTGERICREYNEKVGDYEYKDSKGNVVYEEIEEWRENNKWWAERRWNSVYQWDKTAKGNTGKIEGIRYKDMSTGHLFVIRRTYINDYKENGDWVDCKVYLDLNTNSFVRRTDGEINRELRYKKYDYKKVYVNPDSLKEELREKTKRLQSAMRMDKYDPRRSHELWSSSGYSPEEDWEEAKMPWFGTEEDKRLLSERLET